MEKIDIEYSNSFTKPTKKTHDHHEFFFVGFVKELEYSMSIFSMHTSYYYTNQLISSQFTFVIYSLFQSSYNLIQVDMGLQALYNSCYITKTECIRHTLGVLANFLQWKPACLRKQAFMEAAIFE